MRKRNYGQHEMKFDEIDGSIVMLSEATLAPRKSPKIDEEAERAFSMTMCCFEIYECQCHVERSSTFHGYATNIIEINKIAFTDTEACDGSEYARFRNRFRCAHPGSSAV